MKDNWKILFIIIDILFAYIAITVFIYWIRNPELSNMQVFLSMGKAIIFNY